jgi:hypothetical protein
MRWLLILVVVIARFELRMQQAHALEPQPARAPARAMPDLPGIRISARHSATCTPRPAAIDSAIRLLEQSNSVSGRGAILEMADA